MAEPATGLSPPPAPAPAAPPDATGVTFELSDQFRDLILEARAAGMTDQDVVAEMVSNDQILSEDAEFVLERIQEVSETEQLGDEPGIARQFRDQLDPFARSKFASAQRIGSTQPPRAFKPAGSGIGPETRTFDRSFVRELPPLVQPLLDRYEPGSAKEFLVFEMLKRADDRGVDWEDSDQVDPVLSDIIRTVDNPEIHERIRHIPAAVVGSLGMMLGAVSEFAIQRPGRRPGGPSRATASAALQLVGADVPPDEGADIIMTGMNPAVADLARQIKSQTPEMAKLTEEDLQKRWERLTSAGTTASAPTLIRAAELFVSDGMDNVHGFFDILSFVTSHGMSDEAFRLSFGDHMAAQFGYGREFGQVMVGGVIGGLGEMAQHPIQTLTTRPFSSALILSGMFKALRSAGKLPGRFERMAGAADDISQAIVQDMTSTAKLSAFVAKNLFQDTVRQRRGLLSSLKKSSRVFGDAVKGGGVAGEPLNIWTPKEWAAIQRWVLDAMFQSNLSEQAIVNRVLKHPAEVEAEVHAIAAETERATAQGRLRPGDTLADTPPPTPRGGEYFDVVRASMDSVDAAEAFRIVRDEVLPDIAVGEPGQELVSEALGRMVKRSEDIQARIRGDAPEGAEPPAPGEKLSLRHQQALLDHLMEQANGILNGLDPALFGPEAEFLETQLLVSFDKLPGDTVDTPKLHTELIEAAESSPEQLAAMRPLLTVTKKELNSLARLSPRDEAAVLDYQGAVIDPIPTHPMLNVSDLALGKDLKVVRRTESPLLSTELAETTIGEVADIMEQVGFSVQDTQLDPGKFPGQRSQAQVTRRSLGSTLTNDDNLAILTTVFREFSGDLLRAEGFREKVAAAISKKSNGAITVKGARELLKQQVESTLLPEALTMEVTAHPATGPPITLNYTNEAFKVWTELSDTQKQAVRGAAASRTMGMVSEIVTKKLLREALVEEANRGRLVGPDGKIGLAVTRLVDMVLVDDQAQPQILSGFKPSEYARHLGGTMDKHIARLVEKGWTPEQAKAALEELKQDVNFGYVERSEALAQIKLALGDSTLDPEIASGVTSIAKGFDTSVQWHLKSARAVNEYETVSANLSRMFKGNVTVFNLPTQKNNFLSNLALMGMRRGIGPTAAMTELVQFGKLWKAYRNGTLEDPIMIADFRAIERAGTFNTSLLDGEMGILDGAATPSAATGRLLKAMQAKASALYQFGDNIFKGADALHNMKLGRAQLEALQPGRWMRLDGESGRSTWLIRDGDGSIKAVETQPKASHKTNRVLMDKDRPAEEFFRPIGQDRIDSLLADAATKPGQAIYLNYNKVPVYLQALRSMQSTGAVSPFLTYSWKTLDIPGVKRGMVGNMMFGESQMTPVTNSPAMNALHVNNAIEMSMRRATTMAAQRANLLRADDEQIKQMLKWKQSDLGIIMINEATHPAYTSYDSQSSMNSMAPSMTALMLGVQAFIHMADVLSEDWSDDNMFELPEDINNYDPETYNPKEDPGQLLNVDRIMKVRGVPRHVAQDVVERRKITLAARRGEYGGAADALGLAGINGALILDLIKDATNSKGGPINAQRMFRDHGALFIGGTPKRIMENIAVAFDPLTDLSHYNYAIDPDERVMRTVAQYFWRAHTGTGWRELHTASQRRKWLGEMRTAMEQSFIGDADRRIDLISDQMQASKDERQRKHLGAQRRGLVTVRRRVLGFIDAEIERMHGPYFKIQDKFDKARNK